VLRGALFDAFPESSRLEFDHLEALVDAVSDASFTARDLPEGLRARAEYGTLIISREASPADPLPHLELPVPGTADFGDAGTITARWGVNDRPDADPMTALIDADVLSGPLSAGPPRPGDRMTPLGMTGTRKLQDIFTDAKVPARERSRTPVVRDGDRIVWVAGSRLEEAYRVGPSTARTIMLTWVQPT
jgi:tRNA(Ile)-lysidine synthase